MERERGSRDAECIADGACCHPLVSSPHQESEDVETRFLGKGRENADGVFIFYISNIMEI